MLVIGGGLIGYGLVQRGKVRKQRPHERPNGALPAPYDVPDEAARTDGNIALVVGALLVLGGVFA